MNVGGGISVMHISPLGADSMTNKHTYLEAWQVLVIEHRSCMKAYSRSFKNDNKTETEM